jgi:hypothetical protein
MWNAVFWIVTPGGFIYLFICSLFKDTFLSNSDYTASIKGMKSKWIGKDGEESDCEMI